MSRSPLNWLTGHGAGRKQAIGLSAQGAAWWVADTGHANSGGWQSTRWPGGVEGITSTAMQSVMAAFTGATGSSSASICWVLAPDLTRHWMQTPALNATSLSELHGVAMARASELFGRPGSAGSASDSGWVLAADWQLKSSFVCTAIRSPLHLALQQCGSNHIEIHSPLNLLLDCFKRQRPRDGWLAITAVGELYMLGFAKGEITSLRTVRLPNAANSSALESLVVQEWKREQLRTLSDHKTLHWLPVSAESAPIPSSSSVQLISLNSVSNIPNANRIQHGHSPALQAQQAAWCAHLCSVGTR